MNKSRYSRRSLIQTVTAAAGVFPFLAKGGVLGQGTGARSIGMSGTVIGGKGKSKESGKTGREKFYDPVQKEFEGWPVMVDPKLLQKKHEETASRAFEALENHLQRVKYIMPQRSLAKLQQLGIWIELDNSGLSNMQYHPDRNWLIGHGQDPRLAKHVHIPHASRLYERHMWVKHPYVVLHELAHAYHDQVLGFDHPGIRETFRRAKESGSYDKVLLYTGKRVQHYAMTNHKEYFAETSEAYFGVNDFYPFVRAELKEHDPDAFSLMQEVWGPI